MKKLVDLIIIGTGTAALSAAAEARKSTDKFIIISNGVYGTTCIRNGCMPSKALIHAANLYNQRFNMERFGIEGINNLSINSIKVLEYVRGLRQHFLDHILTKTDEFKKYIIEGQAKFLSANEVELNGDVYEAKSVIIATGSRPGIPAYLNDYKQHVLTSDDVFDLETLPTSIAVIGISILGAEMAQCFSNLGIKVCAFEKSGFIAGLTDPEINDYAINVLSHEMHIKTNITPTIEFKNGRIKVEDIEVEKIFVAQHRVANLQNLDAEKLGIIETDGNIHGFNSTTMQVGDLPIFVAGDVKFGRTILNEAVDESKIAAINALSDDIKPHRRRTPLQICHTSLPAAIAGKAFNELEGNFIIGESDFEDQGCAKIIDNNKGKIRIYANPDTGLILGAELFAPLSDELAHMLSWLIDRQTNVYEALQLPYYHPSLAEGLKNAFGDLVSKIHN